MSQKKQQNKATNSQQNQSSNSNSQQSSNSNNQQSSNSNQQKSSNSSGQQATDCDRPGYQNLDKKPMPYNQVGTLSMNPASHTSHKYDEMSMALFDVGDPAKTGPLVMDNCAQEHIM